MTESAAPAIATSQQEGQAPAQTTPADTQTTPANVETTPAANEAKPDAAPVDTPAKLWSEPSKDANTEPTSKDVTTPEWFMKDKYKTVDDQAKAHYDLQKLMGKNWGAPKDDYSIEGIEGISKDDPLLSHLKPALKELGLSQDGFATLLKGYQDANIKMAEAMEKQVAETLLKNDAMTVQAVDKWLHESFDEATRKTIQGWIVGVDDFKVLNALRTMLPASTNVPSSTGNAAHFESMQEVENEKVKYRKEVAEGLRVKDTNFENQLQQRWKDAYTRESMNKARKK